MCPLIMSPKEIQQPSLICSFCSRSFSQRGHLTRHEKVHRGEFDFVCSHCNAKFVTRSDFNRHMSIHNTQRPYKCEKCPKAFKDIRYLRKHIQLHDGKCNFTCVNCPVKAKRLDTLRCHMKLHTRTRKERLEGLEKHEQHRCYVCNRIFLARKSLRRHLLIKHIGLRRFTCEHCDQKFTTGYILRGHIRAKHTDEKPFVCFEGDCAACYATYASLWSHVRNHKTQPQVCDVCGKQFEAYTLCINHQWYSHKQAIK